MGYRILLPDTAGRTLCFAAAELERYLKKMRCPGGEWEFKAAPEEFIGPEAPGDPKADDRYAVTVGDGCGSIRGANERSVLLGVYHYLRAIGCAFLRPGAEYELIPVRTRTEDYDACFRVTAPLRHRGVCIEGSDSVESVRRLIDWLPKNGYNGFFFQFDTPHPFLERFYASGVNPLRPAREWNKEDTLREYPALLDELRLRGLMQHRMGHGWTSRALNSDASGWDAEKRELTPDELRMTAEIGGRRGLFWNSPADTNLCMSDPDAAEAYARAAAQYARENPDTDYLHLWLADACNNHCECAACSRLRPSDWYVRLMNRVEERLTREGYRGKAVFLLYMDLMWAPLNSRLKHPERFAMMFAPYSRTFEASFDETAPARRASPFRRNRLSCPKELSGYLRQLKNWQKAVGDCDAFDYDYYLARAEMADPTYVNISRLIARDFRVHRQLGLNGISSCQNLRHFLPNALSGYVMGQIALDPTRSYEETAEEYYAACYGKDGRKLLDLMQRLSDCFRQDFVNQEKPETVEGYSDQLAVVPGLTRELDALREKHVPCAYPVQETMWKKLAPFAEYLRVFARMCALRADGKREEALRVYDGELEPLACRCEAEDEDALDVWRLRHVLRVSLKEK